MPKFFATCPKGLEGLLNAELVQLGAESVKETVAGVSFSGDLNLAVRVCLWTRFATRVLLTIGSFHTDSDIELYNGAYSLHYEDYFSSDQTISVDFNGQNSFINNTLYGALRVKDALCDRFVKLTGSRPNVDRENPDVCINAHLDKKNNVTISLDLSGKALHRREYRTEAGIAPLKENLAAAIVARSGYVSGSVVDPMCGSGTLLIEAAMKAADIAPGLFRSSYGFEKLKDFDAVEFTHYKREAHARAEAGKQRLIDARVSFYGFDRDPAVLEKAVQNVERAGLSQLIKFTAGDLHELKNPVTSGSKGFVITNPPYGERLGNVAELLELYSSLGFCLKKEFAGWKATVISSSEDLLSCLRLRADKTYRLYNGALECQLRVYSIGEKLQVTDDGSENAGRITDSGKDAGFTLSTETLRVAEEFANRLKKNLKRLEKWAAREGIEAYRIYDADLPNYNAAIDLYGSYVVIQEYAAPNSVDAKIAHRRMLDLIQVVVGVTGIKGDHVILKVRERKKGESQYEKLNETKHTLLVREYMASFIVNLWDYLDTGLFLDHREVRRMITKMSAGKSFLNIFSYTGSATVAAAIGGARETTTVDMSRTYLAWAKDNMLANGFSGRNHQFIQADCLRWLDISPKTYDLIFADPPTFSNSKRMEATFDVQRDHVALIAKLNRLLNLGGTLIFSNNNRSFKLDSDAITAMGYKITDVSEKTVQEDFRRNKKIHCCFILEKVIDVPVPEDYSDASFGSVSGLKAKVEYLNGGVSGDRREGRGGRERPVRDGRDGAPGRERNGSFRKHDNDAFGKSRSYTFRNGERQEAPADGRSFRETDGSENRPVIPAVRRSRMPSRVIGGASAGGQTAPRGPRLSRNIGRKEDKE